MKKIAIDDFLKSIAPILKDRAENDPKWYKKQLNHIQDKRLKSALASYLKEA
ncbi:hypothetical protein [Ligilactobacillus aviarius]|uniref:hypothetical protein n=1 Tax=Ligilactobacillus aviarius TaxID=1606 RepID=UPI00320B9178